MPTITPGRDFYVTEIPTRDTLSQMASGLQITGIPLSSLESGLITNTVTDTTGASNLAGEGYLWIDANNNIWGKTADGAVRVRRYPGGWETNRLLSWGEGAGAAVRPGALWMVTTISANSTSIDGARLVRSQQSGHNGTHLQPFANQETSPSSANTFFRFTGRGPTRFYSPGFLPITNTPRVKGWSNSSFSSYAIAQDFEADYTGLTFESDEREPEVGSGTSECRGYFMGLVIRRTG